jgi:hypothetical protein
LLAHRGERRRVGHGLDAELLEARHRRAVAVPAHHFELLLAARIEDDDLEQKAIELRLRERIGPLFLDRILRGDDHEIIAERIVVAIDCDGAFVHGLQ